MENVILYPGQTLVTQDSVEVHSTLGSCVEVVLHDPVRRITGMSIFVQPEPDCEHTIRSARYGCFSLTRMLEKMCALGADPQRLLARVLGGSTQNDTQSRTTAVGKKNIDFALSWLRQSRIPVVSSELGGLRARNVVVHTNQFTVRQTLRENSSDLESAYGNFKALIKKVRVIVVENSPSVRATLIRLLEQHDHVDVVGAAADAYEARELLVEHQPDLVLIAFDLPKVSGVDFLQRLMKYFPIPVVMMTRTPTEHSVIAEAFELGAVDCVECPEAVSENDLSDYGAYLQSKVLAVAKMGERVQGSLWNQCSPTTMAAKIFESALFGVDVLLFGGDTGAHLELNPLLRALPKDGPAILLALDALPRNYADRLVKQGLFNLKEAEHFQPLSAGCAYFAPEGYCLELLSHEGTNRIGLVEAPAKWKGLSPREILFQSALRSDGADSKLAAMLLSGLSLRGVDVLVQLRDRGVATLAIDPSSSRVPLLPSCAVALGAVDVTIAMGAVLSTPMDEVA